MVFIAFLIFLALSFIAYTLVDLTSRARNIQFTQQILGIKNGSGELESTEKHLGRTIAFYIHKNKWRKSLFQKDISAEDAANKHFETHISSFLFSLDLNWENVEKHKNEALEKLKRKKTL